MKILIAGASGLIGQSLVNALQIDHQLHCSVEGHAPALTV